MLKYYMFNVCVHLHAPVGGTNDKGEESENTDYFTNIGITARDMDEARSIAERGVTDEVIDWHESEGNEINLANYPPSHYKRCQEARKKGIWYLDPKFLYSDKQ